MSVSRDVLASVGILRRAANESDRLPAAVEGSLSMLLPQTRLDSRSARSVALTDGRMVFVVGGAGCVGLFELNGSGGVYDLDDVLAGRASGTSFAGTGALHLSGLVPDGVESVLVTTRAGNKTPVEIQGNVLDARFTFSRAEELPALVHFSGPLAGQCSTVPGADDDLLGMRSPID